MRFAVITRTPYSKRDFGAYVRTDYSITWRTVLAVPDLVLGTRRRQISGVEEYGILYLTGLDLFTQEVIHYIIGPIYLSRRAK